MKALIVQLLLLALLAAGTCPVAKSRVRVVSSRPPRADMRAIISGTVMGFDGEQVSALVSGAVFVATAQLGAQWMLGRDLKGDIGKLKGEIVASEGRLKGDIDKLQDNIVERKRELKGEIVVSEGRLKGDIVKLQGEIVVSEGRLKGDIDKLQDNLVELKHELKGEIVVSEGRLKGDIVELKREMSELKHVLPGKFVAPEARPPLKSGLNATPESGAGALSVSTED